MQVYLSQRINNIKNISQNKRLGGASTITQQVAKNFLLSSELSYERKIKEAILAIRIERAFSKNEILEFCGRISQNLEYKPNLPQKKNKYKTLLIKLIVPIF